MWASSFENNKCQEVIVRDICDRLVGKMPGARDMASGDNCIQWRQSVIGQQNLGRAYLLITAGNIHVLLEKLEDSRRPLFSIDVSRL